MCDSDSTRTCCYCGNEYQEKMTKSGSARKRKHYFCGDDCTRRFRLKQSSDNAKRRRVVMPEKHKLIKIYIRNSVMKDGYHKRCSEDRMKMIREKVEAISRGAEPS